jgi:hydrogenase expression/formation protein HypC
MCLAIPAQVLEILSAADARARVDVGGARREVNTALLDGALAPGDWVLVHVGFAMSRIDEAEAERMLALLREMGDAFDEEVAQLAREPVA